MPARTTILIASANAGSASVSRRATQQLNEVQSLLGAKIEIIGFTIFHDKTAQFNRLLVFFFEHLFGVTCNSSLEFSKRQIFWSN
jgi:hypothetical protein